MRGAPLPIVARCDQSGLARAHSANARQLSVNAEGLPLQAKGTVTTCPHVLHRGWAPPSGDILGVRRGVELDLVTDAVIGLFPSRPGPRVHRALDAGLGGALNDRLYIELSEPMRVEDG